MGTLRGMNDETLQKRINWAAIGIMLALLSNMAAGTWYASRLSSRVEALEERTTGMRSDRELLVRMDERIRTMAEDITELKRQLAASGRAS